MAANFIDASEESQGLVQRIFNEIGLGDVLHIRVLDTGRANTLIRIKRASPTEKCLSSTPIDVVVCIFEAAFDLLEEETKVLLIHDALNIIRYEYESGKLTLNSPMMTISPGGWEKWKEEIVRANELGLLAMKHVEEEEKRRKEEEKAIRKSKKAKTDPPKIEI